MCIDARDGRYRFLVLVCNCLVTFGSYYCFDMPGVLQAQFQGNLNCSDEQNAKNASVPDGGGGCETPSGLGLTPSKYNLLYAVYAWGNVVLVIPFGYLMDKIGNRGRPLGRANTWANVPKSHAMHAPPFVGTQKLSHLEPG
ncbi:lysosomal dipeptide transporter MFSD1-like [Lampetra fluviatilis]